VRIHYLQHFPIENPGFILEWASKHGYPVEATHLYRGDRLPDATVNLDFLVVMGGPMNIYQHRDHPWLPFEKDFIRAVIDAGKPILGICLGAQLIADVLGARVFQNPEIEIGWFPVVFGPGAFGGLPETTMALHWHGDTFEIPPDAEALGKSAGCARQGFVYEGRTVGLQFHLELNELLIENFVREFSHELKPSLFVQSADEILAGKSNLPAANRAMEEILEALSGKQFP
jgi:GMP synthase-like glutamine amidotransferase